MILQRLKAARKAGVPLVSICTPDQPAMLEHLKAGWNGTPPPMLAWDSATGLRGLNTEGRDIAGQLLSDDPSLGYPLTGALALALQLPERSLLVLSMSDRAYSDNAVAIQATTNLRDPFKATGRTLVQLGAGSTWLPSELATDTLMLDDPLPTEADIERILTENLTAAGEAFSVTAPDEATRGQAIAALIGLPAFSCEQAIALSLREHGAILPTDLQARKRAIVSQVRGLAMNKGDLPLSCLGGLSQAKQFGADLFSGRRPPRLIVIIEEIEKAIAGFGTDTSGTSTDQVGVLLTAMEDNGWGGLMAAGPPGSGKSQFAKSLGPTYGVPVLTLDLGAAKGSLVGQSEERIRAAIKTIGAMGQGQVFFVASCNRLANVPPELRRRFRYGVWFFDLPSAEERAAIWAIQLARYSVAIDAPRPSDGDWTGAEIRNCAEMADAFGRTPADVACYIAPVAQADPESITRLRQSAAGKWLSASTPGFYRLPEVGLTAGPRRFQE